MFELSYFSGLIDYIGVSTLKWLFEPMKNNFDLQDKLDILLEMRLNGVSEYG